MRLFSEGFELDILKSGDTFSGCKILSCCGKGSFGVAYLARNPIGKTIVIKIISKQDCTDRELQGLRNYMPISGSHPNLLQIFHIGETGDGFYYTMEAADNLNPNGEYLPATLGNLMRQGKRFAPGEAVRIVRELLAAVKVMHQSGLIHRDIKPDNIIFVDNVAKLSDPGLVVSVGENTILAGTPGFMPPEVIEKELPPGFRDDLYAVGMVFYCMVTGYSPRHYPEFPGDMPVEICRQLFPALSRMCSRNPDERFSDVDSCLKHLPSTIKSPTLFSRLLDDFRNWKMMNQKKFRIIISMVSLLILLICTIAGHRLFTHYKAVRLFSLGIEQIKNFEAINSERKELIAFQIENYLPGILKSYLANSRDIGNYSLPITERIAVLKQQQKLLKEAAEKLLPVIPEKVSSFKDNITQVAAARGFLSTPLAAYLDRAILKRYIKSLTVFEQKLYDGYNGPTCHREWSTFSGHARQMVFVPSGAVKMAHNGKTVKIPYHFWIGKNETTHEPFAYALGFSPHRSPHANTPVERVGWNDVLYYCYSKTLELQRKGQLPPGYIIRPPNEAEWEYAANNAWLGKDTTPFEERAVIRSNSANRTQPPGSKKPNRLGINDIYGNVYELVLPIEKTSRANTVIIRGGSFLRDEKSCYKRIEYLKFQNIPYDVGFRIAIAPGDLSWFDRHFFINGPARAETEDKVYELIGGYYPVFNYRSALMMAQLLGGRLVEIKTPEEMAFLRKNLSLAFCSWGCFIGARKVNGKWQWISDGSKIDHGEWQNSSQLAGEDNVLLLKSRKFTAAKQAFFGAILLCEWDKKDYPDRNKKLYSNEALPLVKRRFTSGDREFLLIDCPADWVAATRICELLGGRLAVTDTPELRQTVIKELADFHDERIMLGGFTKRNQSYFLNGKLIDFPLKKDDKMEYPTANYNYLTLEKGEFVSAQFGTMFLCELPRKVSSSN